MVPKGQKQNPPVSSVAIPPSEGGFGTIYFGGGTPSVLSLEEVKSILDCFPFLQKSNNPTFQPSTHEVSFECNPEDITPEYVKGLIELGVNRISLGIQSLNNTTLKAIYRSDRESIFRAIQSLCSVIAGNHSLRLNDDMVIQVSEKKTSGSLHSSGGHTLGISINIDFILGLPHVKPGETLENIRELHERFPDITHTSVYMLEDGLYPKEWKSETINEEEMEQEYRNICLYFDTLGWNHYEISNWSKKGYECRHNRGYWDHTDHRGFGLSATSYIDGRRSENSHSFQGYYRSELQYEENLSPEERELEKMIFGMRTFSLKDTDYNQEILSDLEEKKLIERKNTIICLTPAGIFQENTIISRLIG